MHYKESAYKAYERLLLILLDAMKDQNGLQYFKLFQAHYAQIFLELMLFSSSDPKFLRLRRKTLSISFYLTPKNE